MKRLGFGCMRLPLTNPDDPKTVDYKKTCEMFDYFLKEGYTYFDTAYVYHGKEGETALRECLVKRYPRDAFTITTKLFIKDLKKIEDAQYILDDQLTKLGVDYIDYYWLHAVDENKMNIINSLDLFNFILKKKEEGKVKHVGFSFHGSARLLDEILTAHPEMEYVQLQINYLDWESATVQSKLCYDVCVKHGKPVIVMEPIKGGSLIKLPEAAINNFANYNKDASIASWALRFVGRLDNVWMILSGMSTLEQVIDNCKTFDNLTKLNDDEQKIIKENVEIINKTNLIACTACHYCTDGCPVKIAIPEYFDLINQKDRQRKFLYDGIINEGHGKASECIKCGACENICPQKLPIRKYLEEYVVATFGE